MAFSNNEHRVRRLRLLKQLESLKPARLNHLMQEAKFDPADHPSEKLSHGERCLEFLKWIYAQDEERGNQAVLEEVENLLVSLKIAPPRSQDEYRDLLQQQVYIDQEKNQWHEEKSCEIEEAHSTLKQLLVGQGSPEELEAAKTKVTDLETELRLGPPIRPQEFLTERYELQSRLGQGGFSEVWRAVDWQDYQPVAVKILHAKHHVDLSIRTRFREGSKVMRKLCQAHPKIVRVREPFLNREGCDRQFFVMEYLSHGSLKQAIDEDRLTLTQVIQGFIDVGEALHFAHTQGVIHRDVSPSNILIRDDNSFALNDFDLAYIPASLVKSTGRIGDAEFMAPEVEEGLTDGTPQSDLYSLADSLLWAVHQVSIGGKLKRKIKRNPEQLSMMLPWGYEYQELAIMALKEEPEDRPQSVLEFVQQLRALLETSPPESPLESLYTPWKDQAQTPSEETPSLLEPPAEDIGQTIEDFEEHLPPGSTIQAENAEESKPLHRGTVSWDESEEQERKTVEQDTELDGEPEPQDSVSRTYFPEESEDSIADSRIVETLESNSSDGADDSAPDGVVVNRRVIRYLDNPVTETVDYEVLSLLGEGGMGKVFNARQTSLDRTVALKMLKSKETSRKRDRHAKFLAEAIATADLDHPNIVPIYDVFRDQEDNLVYAMKNVTGNPWLDVIGQKSQNDNLEILLSVCDAIAFAHARGLIHRDLKPENVMLGEFGEVLVMDWGLAMPTDKSGKLKSIFGHRSMGGTPAYMAPEMAVGPITKIGSHSDIYLLGAILFEIVSGRPPHRGKNAMKCLMAAAKNEIVKTDHTGELMDIALKALATDPQDRYESVQEFQHALRTYLDHSESIRLAAEAEKDLERAQATDDYEDYAQALFGLKESLKLRAGNKVANQNVQIARLAYAQSALRKGDYDLASSLLDPQDPSHDNVKAEVAQAMQERGARQGSLKAAKRLGVSLALLLFLVVSGAAFWINYERAKTEKLLQEATGKESQPLTVIGESESLD